jgi:hypothetical protein
VDLPKLVKGMKVGRRDMCVIKAAEAKLVSAAASPEILRLNESVVASVRVRTWPLNP